MQLICDAAITISALVLVVYGRILHPGMGVLILLTLTANLSNKWGQFIGGHAADQGLFHAIAEFCQLRSLCFSQLLKGKIELVELRGI